MLLICEQNEVCICIQQWSCKFPAQFLLCLKTLQGYIDFQEICCFDNLIFNSAKTTTNWFHGIFIFTGLFKYEKKKLFFFSSHKKTNTKSNFHYFFFSFEIQYVKVSKGQKVYIYIFNNSGDLILTRVVRQWAERRWGRISTSMSLSNT